MTEKENRIRLNMKIKLSIVFNTSKLFALIFTASLVSYILFLHKRLTNVEDIPSVSVDLAELI